MTKLDELKEDLQYGKKLDKDKQDAFQTYPEKTLYSICMCLLESDNEWVSRQTVVERIQETWDLNLKFYQSKLLNLDKPGQFSIQKKKFNPSDWIGANLTMLEEEDENATVGEHNTLKRWQPLLDRREVGDHWSYRINPEYWDDIRPILEELQDE